MNSNAVLAGTAEIAEHFNVRSNVVGNWIARYPDFPAPLAELARGKVYDLNEVVEWWEQRWGGWG